MVARVGKRGVSAIERLAVDVEQRDAPSIGEKSLGGREPDPPRGSSYQRDLLCCFAHLPNARLCVLPDVSPAVFAARLYQRCGRRYKEYVAVVVTVAAEGRHYSAREVQFSTVANRGLTSDLPSLGYTVLMAPFNFGSPKRATSHATTTIPVIGINGRMKAGIDGSACPIWTIIDTIAFSCKR